MRSRRIGRIAALALLGGLMACGGIADPAGVPDPEAHYGTPTAVDLAVGESTQVDGVEVGFVGVTADSRCPTDVLCVWAGNAAVHLVVSMDGVPAETIRLNSFVEPRWIEWHGVLVRLVEVRPEPISTRHIDPGEYAVRVEVSRLDEG